VISLAEPSLFSAVRFILLPSADSSAQAPYFVSARAGAPVPSSVLPAAIFSSVRCRRCAACYWLHRIRFLISTYSKSVFSSLIEACQHAVVSAPSLSGSRRFWSHRLLLSFSVCYVYSGSALVWVWIVVGWSWCYSLAIRLRSSSFFDFNRVHNLFGEMTKSTWTDFLFDFCCQSRTCSCRHRFMFSLWFLT
jgi:hypothetical protein